MSKTSNKNTRTKTKKTKTKKTKTKKTKTKKTKSKKTKTTNNNKTKRIYPNTLERSLLYPADAIYSKYSNTNLPQDILDNISRFSRTKPRRSVNVNPIGLAYKTKRLIPISRCGPRSRGSVRSVGYTRPPRYKWRDTY